MRPALKPVLIVAVIVLVVGVMYIRLPGAYFCGYDDFLEIHRAAFEDTREPHRVFTTTHFESYKYRPLNRGINLLTYWMGNGDASFFRTRNVLFHLTNVVLVYVLGWLLFGRTLVSGAAALLFGLHPLSNQAVVGSVMTNTAAHACFLFALVCFVLSLRKKRGALLWLGVGVFIGWIGVLIYEASIVIFPLMGVYLFIHFLRKRPVSRRFLLVFVMGSLLLAAAYFQIRSRYVPFSSRQAVPSVKTMVKSAVMYTGALATPFDWVMSNEWFGTPLPNDLKLKALGLLWIPIISGLVILIVLVWLLRKRLRMLLVNSAWLEHVFLLVAAIASLSTLLIFTDKPSETYLYPTVAFAALLFSSLLNILVSENGARRQWLFLAIVAVLSLSFGQATWLRNRRVARCGATAERIVSTLREEKLKNGIWFIWLAPAPGEPVPRRYGMYGWAGVYTLGETAVEPATRWVNDNQNLVVKVVDGDFLQRNCRGSRDVCLWVHTDGAIDSFTRSLSRKETSIDGLR